MKIYPTIVKTKVLSDGSHKIRLAISHRCQTRYIPTRYVVPNESNLNKRGDVVGVPEASSINRYLRNMIQKAYDVCDKIENIDLLTCTQLVDIINNGGFDKPTTFHQISELWLKSKVNCKPTSLDIYKVAIGVFEEFKGQDFVVQSLSPSLVDTYHSFLREKKKYSNVSIRIKIMVFKNIVNFAKKRGYVSFTIDPFIDLRVPMNTKRECALTLEQFKKLRDYKPRLLRDQIFINIFLLSFYMCGMNVADLINVDFTKDSVKFIRSKTERRRSDNVKTEFTIQPEAIEIFKRFESVNGFIPKCKLARRKAVSARISKELFNNEVHLIFYSARKTFAQLAANLEISDSIIEYCLGDVNSSSVISFYRRVTKEVADKAIRKVFDYVKD